MEVGKLYRLKSNEKERLLERQELYARWAVPIGIVVIVNNGRDTFPVDTLIVPLEIHSATKNGTPLAPKKEGEQLMKPFID